MTAPKPPTTISYANAAGPPYPKKKKATTKLGHPVVLFGDRWEASHMWLDINTRLGPNGSEWGR